MPSRRYLLAAAAGIGLLAAWPAAASADLDAARKDELRHLLKHDCGSCHGMTLKGGLGSPLGPETLDQRSDRDLVEVILNGMPGTPMPPWHPLLTREEAQFLVKVLREEAAAR